MHCTFAGGAVTMSASVIGAAPTTSGLPALTQSKLARFTAIVLLYFMQGVPTGLCLIAIPAWLAANGASPIAIGAFVGTSILPWSLKLFNCLLMDRFAYKPMGRRRAWIMIAQAMMVVTLVLFAVAAPSADQIATLTAFLFLMNLCAVFNDVAVDGMTIDLVPHDERTVVNGFMFASQALGISATSFVAGQLLVTGQVSLLAVLLAVVVAIASVFVSLFRERPGERLMPWSAGQASIECEALQHDAWWPILKGVFRSVAAPFTLMFLLGVGLSQATYTFTDAVAPALAVQLLGWGSDEYSSYASIVSLVAALAGAVVAPLLVKLFGLRSTLIGLFLALAATAAIAGATFNGWQGGQAFAVVFALQYVFAMLLTIVTIVWAMRICSPAVAASLFAMFMAVPNFSRSLMSGWSGPVVESFGYSTTYYVVAAIMLAGLVFCMLGRVGDEREIKVHETAGV